MRIVSLSIAALASSLVIAGIAQASIVLTQADFLGMTVAGSNGLNGGANLTANPTYGDQQPNMSGVAGATGNLNPFLTSPSSAPAEVFYGFSAGTITKFTAGSVYAVTAYNDNNQDWELGIWYDDGSGVVESSATTAAGTSSLQGLVLPANVQSAGVFVRNVLNPVAPDDYHASWAVPEATSFLIWGGLAMAGATARRRRRS